MGTKQEIIEIVNNLPHDVLDELLLYIRQIEKKSSDKIRLSTNLNKILKEDKEVLEKLAK